MHAYACPPTRRHPCVQACTRIRTKVRTSTLTRIRARKHRHRDQALSVILFQSSVSSVCFFGLITWMCCTLHAIPPLCVCCLLCVYGLMPSMSCWWHAFSFRDCVGPLCVCGITLSMRYSWCVVSLVSVRPDSLLVLQTAFTLCDFTSTDSGRMLSSTIGEHLSRGARKNGRAGTSQTQKLA